MNFILPTRIVNAIRKGLLLAVACIVFSCQETEKTADTPLAEAETVASPTDTTEMRPAPTFFVIPPDMAEKRVWICENVASDLFHVQHDCPVLIACKGKGSFRNLTLVRAIEDFGRYNCQTCSEALNHVFDEELVR